MSWDERHAVPGTLRYDIDMVMHAFSPYGYACVPVPICVCVSPSAHLAI